VNARGRLGRFGERLAVERLLAAGMRVVARNVRTPGGEIDIIAADGDELAFVEVRTRRGPVAGLAAETVGAAKLRRAWQCAMDYCEREGIAPERARVDLIAIDLDLTGVVRSVELFRGLEIPDN
jgi:putative endonuclease